LEHSVLKIVGFACVAYYCMLITGFAVCTFNLSLRLLKKRFIQVICNSYSPDIRYCADQTPEVVWPRGPGGQVTRSFPCSTSLHVARSKELEAAARSSKTYLAKDGGGRSAPIQSWSRVRASESTEQNNLADTHRNSNVTDKLRLTDG